MDTKTAKALADKYQGPVDVGSLRQIPTVELVPTEDNPRKFRTDQAFADLVASVRRVGILQPIIARPLAEMEQGEAGGAKYEIRAGERRWRAAIDAGLQIVPCVIRDLDDKTAMEITVTENMHRQDLSPLEESAGVAGMLAAGFTSRECADKLGKAETWVLRRARLRDLSKNWQKMATDEKSPVSRWPAAWLELVARFPAEQQDRLFAGNDWRIGQIETLKDLEGDLGAQLHALKSAPWRLDDATLEPRAGACIKCPKRSSCAPGLFDDDLDPRRIAADDRCLDLACWSRKLGRFVVANEAALRVKHKDLVLLEKSGQYQHGRAGVEIEVPADWKKRIVSEYSIDRAKKGDSGAIPALVVKGAGIGGVEWIKPRPSYSSGGRSIGKKRDADGRVTLAEREKALEKRRSALVCENVAVALEKLAPTSGIVTPRLVATLAAVFGTANSAGRCLSGNSHTEWKRFAALNASPEAATAVALWPSVCAVLVERIRSYGTPDPAEAKSCAILFEFDLEAMRSAAKIEIPEPKSWAAERAAGKGKKGAGKAVARC